MNCGKVRQADPEALARMLNGAMMDAALWIAGSQDPEEAAARAHTSLTLLLTGLSTSN